jgi:UDP-glucose 4-epimerase
MNTATRSGEFAIPGRKALVTGGAASSARVVDALIGAGYDVAVVDDLSTGRRPNLNPKARLYEMDIRSPELRSVFEAERPDVVDHHAAHIDVRRSLVDPQMDASINILGSLNLLELSRQFGVRRFVYSSSGGAVYGVPVYLPCDEDHPVQPISQYGASKHAVGIIFSCTGSCGLNTSCCAIRTCGPRQDPNGEGGVVAIFSGRMLRGLPVTINGDGEQARDFVYVEDCARANLLALKSEHCGISTWPAARASRSTRWRPN